MARKHNRWLVGLAITALTMSACGSDEEADTGAAVGSASVSAPGTSDPPTDTSDAAGTSGPATGTSDPVADEGEDAPAEPTGDPIKLMQIYDRSPEQGNDDPGFYGGTQAAAAAINAAGGIQGRPVEIIQCDGKLDINTGLACARDAVEDESVVAMISPVHSSGSAINPLLEEEGMASFGGLALDVTDMTSPNSFQLDFGIARTVGAALQAADIGADSMSIVYLDIPAASTLLPVVKAMVEPLGVEITGEVPIPVGAPDLSAIAAQADSGNPDVILMLNADQGNVRFIQAARQQGIDAVFSTAALGGDAVADLGEDAEGVLVAQTFAPTSLGGPGLAQFEAELSAYDASLDATNQSAKLGWLAMHMFADIASEMETIDRSSFLAVLPTLSDLDERGMLGEVDFTVPFAGLGGSLPQVFNPNYIGAEIVDGELIAITGEFVNPFAAAAPD